MDILHRIKAIFNLNNEAKQDPQDIYNTKLNLNKEAEQDPQDIYKTKMFYDFLKENPYTTSWIVKFVSCPQHGNKRFKRVAGWSEFIIYEPLIDIVSFDEFIKIEKDRIPFFVGTQFGIIPKINDMPGFFNGRKMIAVLGKSVLSGHVSGLRLYQVRKNAKKFPTNKQNEIKRYI